MFRSLSVLSAGVVAIAMAGAANADNDLIRLDGKGDADLLETHGGGGHGGGGHGGGGFHGGGGGFHGGGFGGGGFGGYRGVGYGGYRGIGYGGYGRGFYGSYYRPYYRPYYGYGYGYGLGLGLGYGLGGYGYGGYGGGYGNGYYGVGYGGGYGGSYGSPYYSSYSMGPCAANSAVAPQTLYLTQPAQYGAPQNLGDGTFPYDGGPHDGSVAPSAPGVNPSGTSNRLTLPRDGRLVSVPAASSGYQFVAFGEPPTRPAQRPAGSNSSETLRVSYPAFGEPMPNFAGGTTVYTTVLH